MTGFDTDYSSYSDSWILKLNSTGDTLWSRIDSGTPFNRLGFLSNVGTDDGGFVATGVIDSDALVVAFDSLGDDIWHHVYGGSYHDVGNCINKTMDGGFIITGYTTSFGSGYGDVWILRLNSEGDTLWTRTFGGTLDDEGCSIMETFCGDFIVAGYTESFGAGNEDFWILRLDSAGDTLWTKVYGYFYNDKAKSIIQTYDRGFLVTGHIQDFFTHDFDAWVLRLDSMGDTLWAQTYGGSEDDHGYCIIQTADSGFLLLATTRSFGAGNTDIYLVKVDPEGIVEWETTKPQDIVFSVAPNPFNSSCAITAPAGAEIEIYDISGNVVTPYSSRQSRDSFVPLNKGDRGDVSASVGGIIWRPAQTIASGIYLVRATTEDGNCITKRIVYIQ